MSRYIIFADDDADDLELITGYLKQVEPGMQVLSFGNGKEVIQFLTQAARQRQALPLLLVMDMNMPQMNGMEAVRFIRNQPQLKRLPIIIYSTAPGTEEKNFCDQYAVSWVNKPSDVQQVKHIAQIIADFCRTMTASS